SGRSRPRWGHVSPIAPPIGCSPSPGSSRWSSPPGSTPTCGRSSPCPTAGVRSQRSPPPAPSSRPSSAATAREVTDAQDAMQTCSGTWHSLCWCQAREEAGVTAMAYEPYSPEDVLLEGFLALQTPEGFRAELIDGEIIVSPPPGGHHE